MAKLETKYLGLSLKNPVIVSSCGLSSTVDKIAKLAQAGAGAVVLKSIFEEQIKMEAGSMLKDANYPEAQDYILNYAKSNALDSYLKLIEDAKKTVDIPIIASINCASASEWVSFAKAIEKAGADALELNVFFVPNTTHEDGLHYENLYIDILKAVKAKVSIPVVMKLGQNFSNLPAFVDRLKGHGASGVVLFNRFYAPDISTGDLSFTTSDVLSSPADIRFPLRWTGIISALVNHLDICASTGVHDGQAVVKMLLAGATTVQVCSVLYKNGVDYLTQMVSEVEAWMDQHNFEELKEFRGRMSYKNIPDSEVFERAQFMRYFSNME